MRVIRFSPRTLAKVLVFLVISLIFTFGLLLKIGNLRLFAHTYTLEAEFSDAAGVFRGDAVKVAGVDVGRVQSARIEDGKAIVSFNLDEDVDVPRNSVVGLRWRNVLGQRFLYVYPGPGGGPIFEDGDRIPLAQTEPAGDIGEFLNNLVPVLRAIDPDQANAFVEAVSTALAGNEANVRQLVTDAANLTTQLADMDDQIKSLISASDTVLSTYAAQDQAIGSIIDNLDLLGARLNEMTSDVNSLLVNFSDVQEQLDRLLKDNRENIDVSLQDLDVVAQTLEKSKGDLEATLCTVPIGFAGYFQTTSWGEWFNVRITQFIVKDSNGDTVFTQGELDTERSGDYAGALTGCHDQHTTIGLDGGSSSGSRSAAPARGGSASSEQSTGASGSGGFEDVGGLVRFVIGERGDG